jgi:hypothetical protein
MGATDTMDVGSPWLDKDKKFKERSIVFFHSRLGKTRKRFTKNGKNEGKAVSSARAQLFSLNSQRLFHTRSHHKAFLRIVSIARPINL